ncbi:hypothetical protein EV361DRAFT_867710 [Lentinula raphanica]|nr:hypothetical protein EV361DRAFT_867710 [Lentinula raphanica]
MNLYRLLLFVTLAVHVSGTPTQPSSESTGGAGVSSNAGPTNRPHRPGDASTSNIPPAVPAPARLEPFDDITQLERGNPDPTSDSPLSDYDQTASLTQRRRPLVPHLTVGTKENTQP